MPLNVPAVKRRRSSGRSQRRARREQLMFQAPAALLWSRKSADPQAPTASEPWILDEDDPAGVSMFFPADSLPSPSGFLIVRSFYSGGVSLPSDSCVYFPLPVMSEFLSCDSPSALTVVARFHIRVPRR
ncbi:uncharacterized protein V6R79_019739 [Siganus canaliculatus]